MDPTIKQKILAALREALEDQFNDSLRNSPYVYIGTENPPIADLNGRFDLERIASKIADSLEAYIPYTFNDLNRTIENLTDRIATLEETVAMLKRESVERHHKS